MTKSDGKEVRVIEFTANDADFRFIISTAKYTPAVTHVLVVAALPECSIHTFGASICAMEDWPGDIRVGVPLALKRALSSPEFGPYKTEVVKQFFRRWPEAHPSYRKSVQTEQQPQFSVKKQWDWAEKEHAEWAHPAIRVCSCFTAKKFRASKWYRELKHLAHL